MPDAANPLNSEEGWDVERLKAVAEMANEHGLGWYVRDAGAYPQTIMREGDAVVIAECFEGPQFPPTIAEFIATFDPPTVLKLLMEADLVR